MRVDAASLCALLAEGTDFCIYTHISPDGDAVGSAFGLAKELQHMGKKVAVKCADPWPANYLPAISDFVSDEICDEIGIAVDISGPSRLGAYEAENITICIDHHKSNDFAIDNTYMEDSISYGTRPLSQKRLVAADTEVRPEPVL